MPAWPVERLCWLSLVEPANLRVTPPPTQKDDCSSELHVGKLRSKIGPSGEALLRKIYTASLSHPIPDSGRGFILQLLEDSP